MNRGPRVAASSAPAGLSQLLRGADAIRALPGGVCVGRHGAHIPGREATETLPRPFPPPPGAHHVPLAARAHRHEATFRAAAWPVPGPGGEGRESCGVWAPLSNSWRRVPTLLVRTGTRGFTVWPGTTQAELSEPGPGSPQPLPRTLWAPGSPHTPRSPPPAALRAAWPGPSGSA